MPIARRNAEVVWDGALERGAGTLTSGSGALDELPVTWASRTERPDGKTSPEELIAAAHASCFAMALALVLGENDTPPDRINVSAACTLDEVDGAPRVTTAELTVRARVPGVEEPADLERVVARAADLCPISNALRGNVEINVRSEPAAGAEGTIASRRRSR
jgi:osmotically inducible protein OsmC